MGGVVEEIVGRFVDGIAGPVFVKDEAHRIVCFNDAFCRMLGRSRGELEGKSDFDLVPAEEANVYWERDDEVLRTGQPNENEEALTDAAGHRHWILTRKSLIELPNGRRYIVGVITDLTERRRAEERLIDAIETMSEGFVLFDEDDRLVLCNRKYKELYRESSHAFVPGIRFEDMLRAGLARGQYPDAVGREEVWLVERLAAHRSGQSRFDQRLPEDRCVHVVTRRTSDGGMVGVRIDVTDAKRRQAELQRAKEEAEASSRTKTEFLTNMSHELRTPLNAVIGFSQVLALGTTGALTPKQAQYVNDIQRAGLHLLDLINDVLDLSKVDAGAMALREEAVSLKEVVDACERLIRGRAEQSGVLLTIERFAFEGRIWADPIRLKQVLLNLLSNAVKFTHPAGEVRLSIEETETGMIFVVADNGIGMSVEDIPIALDSFRQLDGSLSRQHEGAGLGLPLAKRLVELHGGALEIASEPGRGTRVIVRLPPERILTADPTAGVHSMTSRARDPEREQEPLFKDSKGLPTANVGYAVPQPRELDRERIADWREQIVAGDLRDIALAFAAEELPAPVARWCPQVHELPTEPLRVLHSYWSAIGSESRLPHHRHIDPTAMRPALGFVMLLDLAEHDDFRYRLYGSTIARVSGFDMTGKLMSHHPASVLATEFAVASTLACVQRQLPLYTERQPAGAEWTINWPRLALPLVDDAGMVVRVIAGTVPLGRDGRIVVA